MNNIMSWGMAGLVLALGMTWGLLWRANGQKQKIQHKLEREVSLRQGAERSAHAGLRALDIDGRISYVSPAFCAMTGWERGDLVGKTQPFCYWPDEDHYVLSTKLAAVISDPDGIGSIEMRVKRADGSAFEAQMDIAPLFDAHGQRTGSLGSIVDVTETRKIRRRLAASQKRFVTVLEALDASVSVAPIGSGELLFANKRYHRWFGQTAEGHLNLALQNSPSQEAVSVDESSDLVDAFAGLPLDSFVVSRDVGHGRVFHLDRLGKWLDIRSQYLHWVDGRVVQMIIATDVSSRHLAEEKAAIQVDKAQSTNRLITMGEMASSIAHELNQPLTSISNYVNGTVRRLRNDQITQDELMTVLEKVSDQARRAGQVVTHIRHFVRRSEPRRTRIHPGETSQRAVDMMRPELERRRIQISLKIAETLPLLYADPILIEQVLLNLIKNSMDAIDGSTTVIRHPLIELAVSAAEKSGSPGARFIVSDNGPGLPETAIPRIFEAFYSTKLEGMGMGLNLCRSIVEAHYGRIQARNRYNDGRVSGCCFEFWLPADTDSNDAVPASGGDELRRYVK